MSDVGTGGPSAPPPQILINQLTLSQPDEQIIAKSFYYVNYGLSITSSNVSQIISVMKT